MKRFASFVLFSALPLAAGSVDVSSQSFAFVHPGASVAVDFGIWNYGLDNPGFSPYPQSFGLDVVVEVPAGQTAFVTGSSAEYYPRYLLQGWVESLDGSVSVPLEDPLAAAVGYSSGTLLLAPGVFDSGASELDVGIISAVVDLSPEMSEALFGNSFTARIILENLGSGVTLGLDPDYTVRSAVSEPGVTGAGPADVAGLTGSVTVENPEPATLALFGAAAAVFLIGRLRSRIARASQR